jgi:peptide methionine sulfoxide reductase msrA/msrB
MKHNKLTKEESRIILHKGTEPPFSGEYDKFYEDGVYLCKRCNALLFESSKKFKSGCGWPSFDAAVKGAVEKKRDGLRIEIVCANCNAHLGHVFYGEFMTLRNTRHCVNSLSLRFIPNENKEKSIVLGGGCFWCLDSAFRIVPGVTKVICGYSGGKKKNPSYNMVCTGLTGHAEVVKIEYDDKKINLNKILEVFFKIHDPTTKNRQKYDIGTQYRSIILYNSWNQRNTIMNYMEEIAGDYKKPIVTQVVPLIDYYEAEEYHQDYFNKNPNNAYCKASIPEKVEKVKEILK